MNLVFITDLHIKARSMVRTGDYLADILTKLEYVAEYTNSIDGLCVIGGDIFDSSTVHDAVKYKVISVLKKFNKTPYAIWGNHDMRYGGECFNDMTSLGTLFVSGVLNELVYKDFGGFVMTGGHGKVETVGKPQIAIRHDLLNMPDAWSLTFDDFTTTDKCIVLMGHDHVDYGEPLVIGDNVRVYRPGAFARTKRVNEDLRIPRVLVIDTDNFRVTSQPIPVARCADELFKLDVGMMPTEDVASSISYDELIASISGSRSKSLSFDECLASVGDANVVDLIMRIESEGKK